MKKYVKPDLYYENFELSVGVAACTGIVFNKDGTVKSYNQEDAYIVEMTNLSYFDSNCGTVVTEADYSGYYAALEDFAFSS